MYRIQHTPCCSSQNDQNPSNCKLIENWFHYSVHFIKRTGMVVYEIVLDQVGLYRPVELTHDCVQDFFLHR